MLFEIHITVHTDDFVALKRTALDEALGYILVKNEHGLHAWQLIVNG